VIQSLRNGDSCHGPLPPEEEEPRVLSYAAAEMVVMRGATSRRPSSEGRCYKVDSTGGGRSLRMWG
jgi:hypothetical protein